MRRERYAGIASADVEEWTNTSFSEAYDGGTVTNVDESVTKEGELQ
jgi:hypothetical protein